MTEHGAYLNTPEKQKPCPECGSRECRMSVYVGALVWQCGHVKALPPMRKRCNRKGCEVCGG